MGTSTVGVGQDYTTLAAWESAKQSDLTGLGDETAYLIGHVQADTLAINITGWTTTASDRICIQGGPSEDPVGPRSVLHATDPGTHAALSHTGTGQVITVSEDYVKLSGFELLVGAAQKAGCINTSGLTVAANLIEVHDVMASNADGFSSTQTLFNVVDTNMIVDVYNCVVMGAIGRGIVWSVSSTGSTIRNCTIIGGGDRIFWLAAGGLTVTNCVSMGGSIESWRGTFTGGGYNASDLADCESKFSDSHNSVDMSLEYVNPSEDRTVADWTLITGQVLEGAGIAQGDITEDISGTTRPDPPSIGAYEVPTAVTPLGDLSAVYLESEVYDTFISDSGGPWSDCRVTDYKRALCLAASISDYNSVSIDDAFEKYLETL